MHERGPGRGLRATWVQTPRVLGTQNMVLKEEACVPYGALLLPPGTPCPLGRNMFIGGPEQRHLKDGTQDRNPDGLCLRAEMAQIGMEEKAESGPLYSTRCVCERACFSVCFRQMGGSEC